MGKRRKIPQRVMDRVVAKQEHLCLYCLLPFGTATTKGIQTLVGDHWIPYSAVPDSSEGNAIASCQFCNAYKSDHLFDDIESARRYILSRRSSQRIGILWIPSTALTDDPMCWTRDYADFLSNQRYIEEL